MRKGITVFLFLGALIPAEAQMMLTLDSCRAMAVRNNKQLRVARLRQDIAANARKAVRTKYLPKIEALGGYELASKEISILNDGQKAALGNLGTNITAGAGNGMASALGNMVQQGIVTAEQASALGHLMSQMSAPVSQALNEVGQGIRDAFRTNNRNMFAASVMVRQPVYMGGAITAANRIAGLNEQMAASSMEAGVQSTLFDVDNTYWLVVSLNQKEKLARNFLGLVRKLDADVQKMIREGVATRADGLKVSVKVNEAEMAVTQAEDGAALARMLLCRQCGLPMDEKIKLADEDTENILSDGPAEVADVQVAVENRPELRALRTAVDISRETTRLVRAAFLPQVALTAGYLVTNPNIYNGYENRFSGVWNVGVLVRVPLWNWMEGSYKIRASKAAACIADMELSDARELIELQVSQNRFKVREAGKKLAMALKNVEKAEENLRCANLGFREGVMQSTEVMEAQTAWMQAQTQKIDAQIDVRMTRIGLRKALGTLR